MNKYNKIGMEVLGYKEELLNPSYPILVRKALLTAVDSLQTNEIIDVDVHFSMKDNEVTLATFEELLLAKPNLTKTAEELFKEYESIREIFDGKLRKCKVFEQEKDLAVVTTESKVELEEIHIISSFKVDVDFASDYFGKSEENELEVLMKRKGFVERFAVLRYNKMMNDFLNKQTGYDTEVGSAEVIEGVRISASPVFFAPEQETYCSEFMIYVDINKIEDETTHDEIMKVAEKKIKEINDYIRIRTIA